MAESKIRVAVLVGGKSAEHEVSLQSARNVLRALDRDKYEPVVIAVDKQGRWFFADEDEFLTRTEDARDIALDKLGEPAAVRPGAANDSIIRLSGNGKPVAVDVVFPVLHGPFGEDGTVQGLLKLAGLPFVGAGVLGSAAAMDKDVAKRLLREAGVPAARSIVTHRSGSRPAFDDAKAALGAPCFVKPANLGSSVGISKVGGASAFDAALDEAFRYDDKVLIEEFIEGREIECSVLGNDDPIASLPGEVIPRHAFYSYEAKYLDAEGAAFTIPADLTESMVKTIQTLAVQSYRALCCEGMARVDFLLRGNAEAFVNEVNTIPGFTNISMYPKLWEAAGISNVELIDRLIQLALERHRRNEALQTSHGLVQNGKA